MILNKNDYLISVIIPLFNGENVIKNNLTNLMNQTMKFENIEILLIDDCSTDETLKIIEKYSKEYNNIKITHLNENHGSPSDSRNIGIKKASSEYIMFLDQDDYYLNDMCKTMYEKIKKEKVDFISCLYYFNSEKNIETAQTEPNHLKKYGPELKISNIKEFPIIYESYSSHIKMIWNKIYNKSFLIKNDITFPKKCLAEDLYFNVQCFFNGKFILLNNYFGYFQINHPDSTSHTSSEKNLYKFVCGYKKIFEYLTNQNYKIPKIISNQIVYWTLLFLENNLSYKKQKNLLNYSQPLYSIFNSQNKILQPSLLISLQNIFIRLFSYNINISIIFTYLFKLFKINKILQKIYKIHNSNLK